jgi:hypothetical protein
MKLTMIFGGFLGFGLGLIFSWAQGSSWPSMIWRASVAALVAGVLLRWWGRLWLQALRDAQQARQTAAARDEASANPSPAKR